MFSEVFESWQATMVNKYQNTIQNKWFWVLVVVLVFAYAFYCTSRGFGFTGLVSWKDGLRVGCSR